MCRWRRSSSGDGADSGVKGALCDRRFASSSMRAAARRALARSSVRTAAAVEDLLLSAYVRVGDGGRKVPTWLMACCTVDSSPRHHHKSVSPACAQVCWCASWCATGRLCGFGESIVRKSRGLFAVSCRRYMSLAWTTLLWVAHPDLRHPIKAAYFDTPPAHAGRFCRFAVCGFIGEDGGHGSP